MDIAGRASRRAAKKKKNGEIIFIHKRLRVNLDEFFTVCSRVPSLTFKLNENCKLNIINVSVLKSDCNGENIDKVNEDVKSLMDRGPVHYIMKK